MSNIKKTNNLVSLTTPLFNIPIPATLYASTAAQRVAAMSEEARTNSTLEEQAAAAERSVLEQQAQETLGIRHKRTAMAKGSVAIVSDESIIDMADAMRANGLTNFENQTAIETWTQEVNLLPGTNWVAPTPVSSHFKLFRLWGIGIRLLKSRVNIIDPIFTGQPEGNIPESYAQAVLNAFNPDVLYRTLSKEEIQAFLLRTGENAERFRAAMRAMMSAWQGRSVKATVENLRAWSTAAILHEKSHFLINAMPTGDIPEAERERLEQLTFERYVQVILADDTLLMSTGGMKNLFKAAMSVKDMPHSEDSRNMITRVWAIETFCDRFAIFLLENYLKQRIIQDTLGVTTWPLKVGELGQSVDKKKRIPDLYTAQQGGPETLAEFLRAHGCERTGEPGLVEGVLCKLQNTERQHVLIAELENPALSIAERQFYQGFLEHIAYVDGEGTINQFSEHHCKTSIPIAAWDKGVLANAGASVIKSTASTAVDHL